jgi:phosphopantothenoylcysteine decarboxylase / phosphopantothenate---cysteine ligase
MLEADELRDELIAFLEPKRLAGRRLLVTAGPTFEAIDPVRGITNHSAARWVSHRARGAGAGAEVTLVSGPVHLPHRATCAHRRHERAADVRRRAAGRGRRTTSSSPPRRWPTGGRRRSMPTQDQEGRQEGGAGIELAENPDILASVARLPAGQRPWCVGFAAESRDLVKHARDKLVRKGVPLIVGNLGPATFGRDDNTLLLVDADGERELPSGPKLASRACWCARSPSARRRAARRDDLHRRARARRAHGRALRELPAYATPGSAGLDLRACIDAPLVLAPGAASWCRPAWRSTSATPGWRR